MDEMEEKDCAKIVKKEQCDKKGDKCKKSCDMCGGGEATTESGEDTTKAAGNTHFRKVFYLFKEILFSHFMKKYRVSVGKLLMKHL